jgi:hypothetical protein
MCRYSTKLGNETLLRRQRVHNLRHIYCELMKFLNAWKSLGMILGNNMLLG